MLLVVHLLQMLAFSKPNRNKQNYIDIWEIRITFRLDLRFAHRTIFNESLILSVEIWLSVTRRFINWGDTCEFISGCDNVINLSTQAMLEENNTENRTTKFMCKQFFFMIILILCMHYDCAAAVKTKKWNTHFWICLYKTGLGNNATILNERVNWPWQFVEHLVVEKIKVLWLLLLLVLCAGWKIRES